MVCSKHGLDIDKIARMPKQHLEPVLLRRESLVGTSPWKPDDSAEDFRQIRFPTSQNMYEHVMILMFSFNAFITFCHFIYRLYKYIVFSVGREPTSSNYANRSSHFPWVNACKCDKVDDYEWTYGGKWHVLYADAVLSRNK